MKNSYKYCFYINFIDFLFFSFNLNNSTSNIYTEVIFTDELLNLLVKWILEIKFISIMKI